jgi:hypothetical protein
MPLANSKIVPAAFWIGFLALGFLTSLGGPDKHRPMNVDKASAAKKDFVAETERPGTIRAGAQNAVED